MTAAAKRRARDTDAKAARREALLDHLEALFAERSYDAITVAALAERSGLAKGTLYLYFPTREAMFLALYMRHARAFADDLTRIVDSRATTPERPERLAAAIAAILAERPLLLRLMDLVHAVLEENIDVATATRFKQGLVAAMASPALALERRLPVLARGDGVRFLIRLNALAVGLWQMASPNPVVAAALDADPGLRPLRIDFRAELAASLAALLRGWR